LLVTLARRKATALLSLRTHRPARILSQIQKNQPSKTCPPAAGFVLKKGLKNLKIGIGETNRFRRFSVLVKKRQN